jgi:hypothetical protein
MFPAFFVIKFLYSNKHLAWGEGLGGKDSEALLRLSLKVGASMLTSWAYNYCCGVLYLPVTICLYANYTCCDQALVPLNLTSFSSLFTRVRF